MDVPKPRVKRYRDRTQLNDLKQHADKIIQGIKKIGPNHAKRAIWELFQNAVDLSPNCEISIRVYENELIFSHNGVPFTMQTLDCLFTQVSSKTLSEKKLNREEADPIGQYGTGFMTSHSFGDIVKVSGAIKDDFVESGDDIESQGHIKFKDLIINRTTQDWEKLCIEISRLREKVEELLSLQLTSNELPETFFKYDLNTDLNKKRANDAIESLKVILPYVMIFNERLKQVTVTDISGNKSIYHKEGNELKYEGYCSQIIRINNEVQQINFLRTERLTIILPFELISNKDGFIGKCFSLPDSLPKLFLFYPLIGTENFGLNFVIHSKNFQPTEPRDGLHLNSLNEKNKIEEEANKKLMEEASSLIFDFLQTHLPKLENPHLLAKINFSVSSDDQELNQYFLTLKDKWTHKFRSLPFVETFSGCIAAQDAVFFSSNIIEGAEPATLQAMYNIVGKFFPSLPKSDLIPIWTKLVDEWDVEQITQIEFSDVAEKLREIGSVHSFVKAELILLYKEMIRKGEGDLFVNKALIPNIRGDFKGQSELSESVDLSEQLMPIADVINPKISNRQVDPDFLLEELKFEPFGRKNYMELINISLDEHIKDATRSSELPENYLFSLIQYASIVPKKDSTIGPARVIKLIAEYYNFSFDQIVLPTLASDNNIDVRTGQFHCFKIFLNDISVKDKDWVESNISYLVKVLREAFSYADVKKFFLRYDVYPNQDFELKAIIALHKDNKIPEFVKKIYNKVVEPNGSVNSRLAHPLIEDIYSEMKLTNSLDLSRLIEQKFFGESGNEIQMENHPFRTEIIEIIKNFKSEQNNLQSYERCFPATHRNKSSILVQLADGNDSFTILSQSEEVIKKLAGIANHPHLDDMLKLGADALRMKQQDEAEMKYKKQIGNHLEDVLRKELAQKIDANIINEQDGQDLIIYVKDLPVYYVEVKSKWLETTPIRISRRQTLSANENPDCYALCSIDMTDYSDADRTKVESIDKLVSHMRFNIDVGHRVEHLISVYSEASQEDKFSLDGDYRTLIPATYIREGITLSEFEKQLTDYLKKKYDK